MREISYFVVNSIIQASTQILAQQGQEFKVNLMQMLKDLVPVLEKGMSDNWSQVRYASAIGTRSLYELIAVAPQEDREAIKAFCDPLLVPKMCLNRYYVAEGVRIYSIETWKRAFGDQGKHVVSMYAQNVCEFYIVQSLADNHAVREAACHCIAELCTKVALTVSKEPFKPYVQNLLKALLDCFKDESWPVRDAACGACVEFVTAFPEESTVLLPELLDLWFHHLSDNITSVREHSAMSLGRVMTVFEAETLPRM